MIRIVTDSASDLPEAVAAELGIEIVPLTIRFGEEEFVDRRDLTPEEFWRRSHASKELPETAAPAPGAEPTVSYWETRGRELVLYWRGLTPRQKVSLGVDLIAEVPGEYRGPASRAYLYYDADHKHWVEPVSVKVRAK